MKMYGRVLLAGIFILIAIAGVVLAVGMHMAGPVIEKKLRQAVRDGCATCDLKMESLGLSPWGVEISGLTLTAGKEGGQHLTVKVPSLVVRPSWATLMDERPRIRTVTLTEPEFIFADGDARAPAKRGDPGGANEKPAVDIDAIILLRAKFTYVRDHKNTHAVLVIHAINADVHPSREPALQAHVEGRIGEKGSVTVDVTSPVFKRPLEIDTDFVLKDQSLEALSEFFKPNAGVELKGTLTGGRASTKLRDRHLSAAVWVEFKDFDLKVNPMYDRNDVQAFFTNLGANLAMQKKNTQDSDKEKMNSVEIDREKDESIVSFILRGLKQAAIPVTL